jgi:hypothetical protein
MTVHQLLAHDFVRVPNAILFDRQLSLGARVLYMILLSYDWQPGQPLPPLDTLQEAMQCDTEALLTCLYELKVHGVLEG